MALPIDERHALYGVLGSMARIRAESALNNWHEGGQQESLRVPLDAGIATELMVKAFLAAHNVALLLPDRPNPDTLLHLTGFGDRAETDLYEVQTVGLNEALKRVRKILDTFTVDDENARRNILKARNPVVHLGTVPPDLAVSALRSMVKIHDELGREIQQAWDTEEIFAMTFWGDHAETVRHLLDDQTQTGLAKSKVAAAKVAYQRRFGRLTEEGRVAVVNLLEGHSDWVTAGYSDVQCPACDAHGVLAYDGIDEGEAYEAPRPSTGEPARYIRQRPEVQGFDCSVCGLSLEGAAVTDAEMTWKPITMEQRLDDGL